MKEQNFTQFAIANEYPSDYDILDHGDLSPSGHVSGRARRAMQQRQSERATQNLIAHDEYNKAIMSSEVVDPSGEVTREALLARQQQLTNSKTKSRKNGLYRQIELIEGLGRMSHLSNGKLKISYRRTVDEYQRQLSTF